MNNETRMDYHLIIQMNQVEIPLKDNQTYDEWVADNIFPVILNKLEECGLKNAGVGFPHYAHVYKTSY